MIGTQAMQAHDISQEWHPGRNSRLSASIGAAVSMAGNPAKADDIQASLTSALKQIDDASAALYRALCLAGDVVINARRIVGNDPTFEL
jgi:hypothetical protein